MRKKVKKKQLNQIYSICVALNLCIDNEKKKSF